MIELLTSKYSPIKDLVKNYVGPTPAEGPAVLCSASDSEKWVEVKVVGSIARRSLADARKGPRSPSSDSKIEINKSAETVKLILNYVANKHLNREQTFEKLSQVTGLTTEGRTYILSMIPFQRLESADCPAMVHLFAISAVKTKVKDAFMKALNGELTDLTPHSDQDRARLYEVACYN